MLLLSDQAPKKETLHNTHLANMASIGFLPHEIWFGSATNNVAYNTEGLLSNGVVKILLIITHNHF